MAFPALASSGPGCSKLTMSVIFFNKISVFGYKVVKFLKSCPLMRSNDALNNWTQVCKFVAVFSDLALLL